MLLGDVLQTKNITKVVPVPPPTNQLLLFGDAAQKVFINQSIPNLIPISRILVLGKEILQGIAAQEIQFIFMEINGTVLQYLPLGKLEPEPYTRPGNVLQYAAIGSISPDPISLEGLVNWIVPVNPKKTIIKRSIFVTVQSGETVKCIVSADYSKDIGEHIGAIIDWGDGSHEDTTGLGETINHTYDTAGLRKEIIINLVVTRYNHQPIITRINVWIEGTKKILRDVVASYDAEIAAGVYREGIIKSALELQYSTDGIVLPELPDTKKSIALWIRTSEGGKLLTTEYTTIAIDNEGININGRIEAAVSILDDRWHFIAITFYQDRTNMYVDDKVYAIPRPYLFKTPKNIKIGFGYIGLVDNISIYEKALEHYHVEQLIEMTTPQIGTVVAERIQGAVIGTYAYWDGINPEFPVDAKNGQEHTLYNTETQEAKKYIYFERQWRKL
jgi:hypothetical protein